MDRIRLDPVGAQDVADGDGTSRGHVMMRVIGGRLGLLNDY